MAYKTYTTKALVCGTKDSYTSDRSYLLFSEEAGMLWATARSVREEKSKQRYALQNFSLVRVSLVKGRSGWRIGSVEAIRNPFMEARSRKRRAYLKNIVSMLRRYIHGEQALPSVFADTEVALCHQTEEIDTLYLLFTVRLLYALGYVSKKTSCEAILETENIIESFDSFNSELANELEQIIQKAHNLSQL